MSKSRQAICDILDEALITFDDFDDGALNEPADVMDSPGLSSVSPTRDLSFAACIEKACAPSTIPEGVDDEDRIENEKPSKKRSWKKPEGKPKRPLSAYNLFFQLERENIISGGKNLSPDEIAAILKAKDNRQQPKEKRRHRKTHGKVSFGNLARSIADKWKTLDKERRAVYEHEADQEKMRYRNELEEWNRKKEMEGWNDKPTKGKKSEPVVTPDRPAPRTNERLSGLADLLSNQAKPPMKACNNTNSLNSIMLLNNPYHALLQQEDRISLEKMKMLQHVMCPTNSGNRSLFQSMHGHKNCSNLNNHPYDYNFGSNFDLGCGSCAHHQACHMPAAARCACQHESDLLKLEHLQKKMFGKPPQPSYMPCHPGAMHDKEFGRYYPLDAEPLDFKPMLSLDESEAMMASAANFSAGNNAPSNSLNDDLLSFMKTFEK